MGQTVAWDLVRLTRIVVDAENATDYDAAYYRAFVSCADPLEIEAVHDAAYPQRIEAGRWH